MAWTEKERIVIDAKEEAKQRSSLFLYFSGTHHPVTIEKNK